MPAARLIQRLRNVAEAHAAALRLIDHDHGLKRVDLPKTQLVATRRRRGTRGRKRCANAQQRPAQADPSRCMPALPQALPITS